METQRSSPSNVREQGYKLAYELACEQLASMDMEELCSKSGAQYVDFNKITIDYLNQSYLITFPTIEISLKDSEEEVPQKDKILILHYCLLYTSPSPRDRS